jgi:2-keto-4-pentenoate hydratase
LEGTFVTSTIAERAAAVLLAARRDRTLLLDLPANLQPTTIEGAYAIQDASVRQHGKVRGWKVGPAKNGDEPRCSPLTASLLASPASVPAARPVALELELEVAATLAADLAPRGRAYAVEDVAATIGSLHLAFELIGSRFEDRKRVSSLTAIADQQSNAGIVIGPGLSAWRELDLSTLELTLAVGGEQVGAAHNGPSTAALLELVTWLANHATARGTGLRAGEVIITGARLGPCPVPHTGLIEGKGVPFERVSLTLIEPEGTGSMGGEPI